MLGGYNSGSTTTHKHWSIGTSARDSTFLDIGFHAGTDPNPVAGIRNYNGSTIMTLQSDGKVGIGTLSPAATLDVGPFRVDSGSRVTQTSDYVKEFSGTIQGPGNWPNCNPTDLGYQGAKYVTIGTISTSNYGTFIDITLYGSHRGFNRTNYFDHSRWILMVGDKISSNKIENWGSSPRANLWNGSVQGDYDNIDVVAGFPVVLVINPYCGANLSYTYVVRYRANASFTPSSTRSW